MARAATSAILGWELFNGAVVSIEEHEAARHVAFLAVNAALEEVLINRRDLLRRCLNQLWTDD